MSSGRELTARVLAGVDFVLWAAESLNMMKIAGQLGNLQSVVGNCRKRINQARLAGSEKDLPRGGRQPTVRARLEAVINCQTTDDEPAPYPTTIRAHAAKAMGTNQATVQRFW